MNELAGRVLKAAQVRAVLMGFPIPDAIGLYFMTDGWHCSVPEAESPSFADEAAALRWAFAEYVRQIDALASAKRQAMDEIKAILDQARELKRAG